MDRITGTVSWYSDDRGFGFITPDDGHKDCFVHHTQIEPPDLRSLEVGDRVEFQAVESPKGPAARSVVKL